MFTEKNKRYKVDDILDIINSFAEDNPLISEPFKVMAKILLRDYGEYVMIENVKHHAHTDRWHNWDRICYCQSEIVSDMIGCLVSWKLTYFRESNIKEELFQALENFVYDVFYNSHVEVKQSSFESWSWDDLNVSIYDIKNKMRGEK